jgi:hypothetical protein
MKRPRSSSAFAKAKAAAGRSLRKALLDPSVRLDGAVVVEMVVAEHGEDPAVEVDTGDPTLVDRVRGHLHEAVAAAGTHHRRQHSL